MSTSQLFKSKKTKRPIEWIIDEEIDGDLLKYLSPQSFQLLSEPDPAVAMTMSDHLPIDSLTHSGWKEKEGDTINIRSLADQTGFLAACWFFRRCKPIDRVNKTNGEATKMWLYKARKICPQHMTFGLFLLAAIAMGFAPPQRWKKNENVIYLCISSNGIYEYT